MKNIHLTLLAILITISSISCSSDDYDNSDTDNNGSTPTENFLKIGGINYELKDGTINDYNAPFDGEVYNFDIGLYTTNLTSSGGLITPKDEVFTYIKFELITNNNINLAIGSYRPAENSYEAEPYTYLTAGVTIEYDLRNTYEDYQRVTFGNVLISQNGATYEISFEGTTASGTPISFKYTGALIVEE